MSALIIGLAIGVFTAMYIVYNILKTKKQVH
jgi:tetrahydromethanopterin S-methyltransferase subunit F